MFKKKERTMQHYCGMRGDCLYNTYAGYELLSSYYPKPEDWYKALYEVWSKDYWTIYPATVPDAYLGAESFEWFVGGRKQYNECDHRISRAVNLPFLVVYKYKNSPSDRVLTNLYYRLGTPAAIPYSIGKMQHPAIDYQAVRARAWHNMQPRFEGQVSMLNFLFELKDFRDVAKYIFKYNNDLGGPIRKSLSRAMRNTTAFRKFNPKKPANPIPDPTVPAAKGLLLYNFAIAPLVSDLGKIFQQANEIVREVQKSFQQDGSKDQKSHYSEIINVVDNRSAPGDYWEYTQFGVYHKTRFTATMHYMYDYTMRDTVDAWMKYWGLTGSYAAFWNMIPFSFVVDYFVQIGNSIRAMEHDPNVDLHLVSYGESLLTEFNNGYTLSGHPHRLAFILDGKYYQDTDGDGTLISGHKGSIFTRVPRDPYYGPATPRVKWPSTKQALNMAALVRCLL